MQEAFFTSKQAAEITGCTLRQLQYWREKEVVVPTINATGTGRSVYYSTTNLLELAVMVHFLSVGLSFDLAGETLKTLKDKEPELFTTSQCQGKRFMLLRRRVGVGVSEAVATQGASASVSEASRREAACHQTSPEERLSKGEKIPSLFVVEFDREKAIASLEQGQPVIPVWLDIIYQQLAEKLGK